MKLDFSLRRYNR